MHYSKIEAANVPSLFDVHHDNASLCGRNGKTGPRQAVKAEIKAYAEYLAFQGGLMPREAWEVIGCSFGYYGRQMSPVMGITYGKMTWCEETRAHEYESGSFSVPFPGRNAHRDKVTMETLDDAGEVVTTSTLPVEPKKGGVIWDKAAVQKAVGKIDKPRRGKVVAPVSMESPAPVETPPAVAQEPAPAQDCPPEAVTTPDGPEIGCHEAGATNPEIPDDLSTTLDLAEQVAALAATVAAMQSALDAIQAAAPVEGMTAAPPVSGKRERTAAHVRAIWRAWAERKARREAWAIAARHRDARNTADDRANGLAFELRQETRRADEAVKDALRVSDIIRARDAEIATLKAKPHHMGQEVRPDDYQRLVRERDEARASLASDREKLRMMRSSLDRGTDALDMMTDRALRAENALRAVEHRQARIGTPYRATVQAVTFGRAA